MPSTNLNTMNSASLNNSMVPVYNHAHNPDGFDVDECISDLMCNGEGDRGDNQPNLTIDAVANELSENISTQELVEIFILSQQGHGIESQAIIRRYLKCTARKMIENDMPQPLIKRTA